MGKEQIIENPDIYIKGNTLMIPNDIFRKAKQMEKEQIKIAYKYCHDLVHIYGLDTEQYYNETYGKD